MESTSSINTSLSAATLLPSLSSSSSPHDSLPLDLVEENLLPRLPVKSLLQFRSVHKSWKSLISDDSEFAKKQLLLSTTKRFKLLTITLSRFPPNYFITCYPIHSILTCNFPHLEDLQCPPFNPEDKAFRLGVVGSCHGIVCFADYGGGCGSSSSSSSSTNFILLCNPTIRKFKELPPCCLQNHGHPNRAYGFGHDPVTDNYKVVVVNENEVNVHTLGTDFWRRIGDFPFVYADRVGRFVSGTINWLASPDMNRTNCDCPCLVVSLDLGKESFREILQPDYYGGIVDRSRLILSVVNDCLCILADHDVWIMTEFGNRESWTKLITIPYLKDPSTSYGFYKLVCISEDDQVVLQAYGLEGKLVVYDSRNGVVKYHSMWNRLELYVESLMSP